MPRDREKYLFDMLDPDIVWYVVQNKLPVLRVELESLLGDESQDGKLTP